MARRRMLSPEIWESESFGSLSLLGKILWIGMISNADDEGIGRAQPNYLKSRILPYDELRIADIEKALAEIGQKMSVTLYEVDKNKYYYLNNWLEWQSINKPTKSKFPAPPNGGVRGDIHSTDILPIDYGSTTVVLQDDYRLKEIEEKGKEKKRREEKEPDGSACDSSLIKQIIDYLNLKCDTAYKSSADINKRHINARVKEGYKLDDFKNVIDKKVSEWKGTEYEKYLRPETLFGSKFESYLNAKITAKESVPKYGQIGINL